jgi:molybdopterin converting factor subunit 1
MRVRVLYFGVLQERLGTAEEPVELPAGATVGELLRVLRDRTSNQAMGDEDQERLWRSLAVAVNQEYGSPGAVLREADEVALLPPVSGGTARTAKGALRAQRQVQ